MKKMPYSLSGRHKNPKQVTPNDKLSKFISKTDREKYANATHIQRLYVTTSLLFKENEALKT